MKQTFDRSTPRTALVVAGAALLTIVSWPGPEPDAGLDPSWMAALHLAAQQGIAWGKEIVFTFGPLGYLGYPTPFLGWTSALATLVTTATLLALAFITLRLTLASMPLPVAVTVSFVLVRIAGSLFGFEELQALVLMAVVQAIRSSRPLPWDLLAVLGGAVAGFALLTKLNVGVAVFGIVVLGAAAVGPRPTRTVALAIAATGVSALCLWLAAGQPVSNILDYVSSSIEIVRGYSGAMGLDVLKLSAAPITAAFALAVLVPCAGLASRGWSLRRRGVLAAVLAVEVIVAFKHGFVRVDHAPLFVVAMLFTTVALLPDRRQWQVSAAFVATLLLAGIGVAGVSGDLVLAVQPSATRFAEAVTELVTPWRWDSTLARTQERIRAAYELPLPIATALAGRTVHFDPWETSLAVAYPEANWTPEPVFQSYSAYTPSLDALNRDFLASSSAPELIVRHVVTDPTVGPSSYSIDGRSLMWEQPATTAEMICRYREVEVSLTWQLLERGPSRCGSSRIVETQSVLPGAEVRVPVAAPGELLVVRIEGLRWDPLVSTLLRDPIRVVLANGVPYRLVPATAADGLLLAMPPTAGWSADFGLDPPISTLQVLASSSAESTPISLTFEAIPLTP